MRSLYVSFAAGVFVGNFLYYTVQKEPVKGAIIGVIASVIMLVFGWIFERFSK